MSEIRPRIVIVGGTSGIGLATATLFAERGAHVGIVGRDREKLVAALRSLGSFAEGEAFDACDRAALDAFFGRIAPIDHLILAASAGSGAGPFAAMEERALRRGFEGKFWVHWHAAQAALPHIGAGGSITFVTAASSRRAGPGTSGLAAINGALESLTRTLARELAPLRVNAVSPGVVETPWWADKPAGMFEAAGRAAPLARPGRVEDVAQAIAFLVDNRFVTGVVLDVDGGLHLT
ncbi:MAG: SDR family oxidoreductase [Roseiarcus sp.]|jgi:NAD(P)-dependent dehydrogenase (short-subunit alcohol dehydrogenase family)